MSISQVTEGVASDRGYEPARQPQKKRGLLNRLKIGHRIFGGFLAVVALVILVSLYSWFSLDKLDENFAQYGDLAGDTTIAIKLQTNLTDVQLAARNFMAKSTEQNADKFNQKYQTLLALMEQAHDEIHATQRVKWLDSIDDLLGDYKKGFDQLVVLMNNRNELIYTTLADIGNDINKRVDKVNDQIESSANSGLVVYSNEIREDMLMARLNLMKFVDDNKEETISASFKNLEDLKKAEDKIRGSLISNELSAELTALTDRVKEYVTQISALQKTIEDRNVVRDETLDDKANEILATADKISSSLTTDSQALQLTVSNNFENTIQMLLIAAIIASVIGIGFAFLISRGITKPVLSLTGAMNELAEGNLAAEVPGKERGDELGEMAGAVQVFKENAIRTKELEEEQIANQHRSEQEKRAMMDKLANDFNDHIGGIIDTVSSASEELSSNAKSMADVSDQTEKQVAEASAASAQTSGNVQTVATATEEMTSTIGEISEQVQQASHSAREAVTKVDTTNQMMELLAQNSNKIGEVVEMISQIAEQTNLLALNATIESARAGEAGKGFAVVAGEVKELAGQTAKATDEIAQQIHEIQSATEKASLSMHDVSLVIQRLDEFTASIASAMEQQNAATGEISHSIHQAAQGTEIVDNSINSVSRASQEAAEASGHVMLAAGELAKQSEFLKSEVQRFISHVREG